MGWTLSGVQFQYQGAHASTHSEGNNVAWMCACGHPVLLVYQNGRIGSHPATPSTCLGCGTQYSLHPPYGFQPEPPSGTSIVPASLMFIV